MRKIGSAFIQALGGLLVMSPVYFVSLAVGNNLENVRSILSLSSLVYLVSLVLLAVGYALGTTYVFHWIAVRRKTL